MPRSFEENHKRLKGALMKAFEAAKLKTDTNVSKAKETAKTGSGYSDKQKNLAPPNQSEKKRAQEKVEAALKHLRHAQAELQKIPAKPTPQPPRIGPKP